MIEFEKIVEFLSNAIQSCIQGLQSHFLCCRLEMFDLRRLQINFGHQVPPGASTTTTEHFHTLSMNSV